MNVSFTASIDPDALASTLSDQLNNDELFEFVKTLDLITADWSFTGMLISYFEAEKEKFKKENE